MSVILFRGGEVFASGSPEQKPLPPGQTPPRQTPPWADTHQGRHTPAWADHPLGRHRPAQCMLGYTPCPVHAGIHPPAQCMLGYGQQVDGTHPTGMHSCLIKFHSFCDTMY